jgi:hypothetical protein
VEGCVCGLLNFNPTKLKFNPTNQPTNEYQSPEDSKAVTTTMLPIKFIIGTGWNNAT